MNRFTPSSIGTMQFSIPLYQRLFEWEEQQIVQLLSDLYSQFKENKSHPYYIGMFTVFSENGKYSLVDGQQRFTVLNLMGIAFQRDSWNTFLKVPENGGCRLSFFARKSDEQYLRNKIEARDEGDYINKKMENGIGTIQSFVSRIDDPQESNRFIDYIYHYATFFISDLPASYQTRDLNKYFEAMNAAGRGLENHEILKVDLLKKLADDKEFYAKVWNVVSDMDKCLIRQRTWDRENAQSFKQRIGASFDNLDLPHELFNICNDSNQDTNNSQHHSIRNIRSSKEPPKKQIQTRDERSILSFSEFLLQVLWIQLSDEKKKHSSDFFNTQKLQETFQNNLQDEEVKSFFDNLLKYRILFDYYILRVNNTDQNSVSYFINFAEDNADVEENRSLLHYQSMLLASTSSYLWLSPTLKFLANNPTNIQTGNFVSELKQIDNRRHESEVKSLQYGRVDRYWFWRLDYYLWENRKELFKNNKALEIADKYVFKPNRSIEHIAPQTPKSNSNIVIGKDITDLFGNLAMISSGQNSSLQNESYEVKRAHVESFITGSKGGSIESLKMLKIYEIGNWSNESWTEEKIKVHQNEMVLILIKSFPDEFREVRSSLEGMLFKEQYHD